MKMYFKCIHCQRKGVLGNFQNPNQDFFAEGWRVDESNTQHTIIVCGLCGTLHDVIPSLLKLPLVFLLRLKISAYIIKGHYLLSDIYEEIIRNEDNINTKEVLRYGFNLNDRVINYMFDKGFFDEDKNEAITLTYEEFLQKYRRE